MKKPRFTPDIYLFAFLIISTILHFTFPIAKVIFVPYSYVGWLFIAAGAVFGIWPDFIFKREKTTVQPHEKPTKLVISGPFRVSRHPIYLGFALILFGVSVIHGTMISFPFPFLFALVMERKFIPMEEKNLEETFGQEYLDYKRRVRKWL